MENGLIPEKIDCYLKHNEIDDSDKVYDNFYNKSKLDKKHPKRKARTQNDEPQNVNKKVSKTIKNYKKKPNKKIKTNKETNKNKSLSIQLKNRKRARTPLKEKSSLDLFNQEDKKEDENFDQIKGKKSKNDEDLNYNGVTELNNSYDIFDNTNLLKTEDIFEEIEKDEKIGKEDISNLQEMLCNNPIFEQRLELQDEDEEIPNQPPTQAFTILFEN